MTARLTIMLSLFTAFAWAQEAKRDVSEGNEEYHQGNFEGAVAEYEESLQHDPKMVEALFNLGDAKFRQEDYETATKQFEKAIEGLEKPEEKSMAYHNLGNSLLQSGKLKESIEAYKHALRNNPKDEDTRYNLAFAQKMLREQEQQQQQQKKDQNQDQDKQEKNQDQEKNENKENQEKEEQKEEDKQEKEKEDQQKDQEEQKQQKSKPEEISKEDAERMLEAMKNEEKETQDKLRKQKFKAVRVKIEKEW